MEDASPKPIRFEPTARRVRVVFAGETIADSARAMLMVEPGHLPVYYLPRADVRLDLLEPSERRTLCPRKGEARYWSIVAGGRRADNAAWSCEASLPGAPPLGDHVAFVWDAVDHWYEEDEEIFRHPRDPLKRVDAIRSSRRVEVVLGGTVVADTTRAVFLFETGLPTRYYMPREDVGAEVLRPSDTHTVCPYKGRASYHSVVLGGATYPDIVWFYPDPIPEIRKIEGLLSFYNEKVDVIRVDGVVVEKVRTPWS